MNKDVSTKLILRRKAYRPARLLSSLLSGRFPGPTLKTLGKISLLLIVTGSSLGARADDFSDALNAYNSGQFARATDIWRDLAEQDNIEAQYALGVMYFKGEGIAQNRELAVAWFQKAANRGHLASMFNMGVSLWTGEGAQVDLDQAIDWWRQAAENGYAPAQYNLGIAFYVGDSIAADEQQAGFWLEQAAAQNYADASSLVARLNGGGVAATGQPTAETALLDSRIEGGLNAQAADSTPVISDPGSNDDLLDSLDTVVENEQFATTEDASGVVILDVQEDTAADESIGENVTSEPVEQTLFVDAAYVPAAGGTAAAVAAESAAGESETIAAVEQADEIIETTEIEPAATDTGPSVEVATTSASGENATAATAATAETETPESLDQTPLQALLIDTIRIGGQPAPVYAANNRQAPVIETLAPGTPVRVVEQKGGFSRIEAPGGFPVWVYGRYVRVDGIWAYITGNRVNARSLPSTARTAVSLGLLSQDARLAFLEARPGWIHVRAPETFSAWIETEATTNQNEPEDGFKLAWNSARQGVIGE